MHEPTPGDDGLATRASLLGRLKNWDDSKSWEEFILTYSCLMAEWKRNIMQTALARGQSDG